MCYSIANMDVFVAGEEMTAPLQIYVFIMNCGLVASERIVVLLEFQYSSNNKRKKANDTKSRSTLLVKSLEFQVGVIFYY